MKKCFKCGKRKPLGNFYVHKSMDDGHLGKCKECTKKDVRNNRHKRIDYYRAQDRERGNRQTAEYRRAYRRRFPNTHRAHQRVDRAVASGELIKTSCEVCGNTNSIMAHHDDYNAPLVVRWLCGVHHCEWHRKHGAGKHRNQ